MCTLLSVSYFKADQYLQTWRRQEYPNITVMLLNAGLVVTVILSPLLYCIQSVIRG